MKRWRASLPRYRTPIIIQRSKEGTAGRIGNQARRSGVASNLARVLRAFNTTDVNSIIMPTVPAPINHEVLPTTYAPDWVAWWPDPPGPSPNPYKIPDPPDIPRTVLPTRALPILWEAYAEVGTNVWNARISAVWASVEWMPQTGNQKMSGIRELSINEAALKMRPKVITTADINAKEWSIVRVKDNTEWKLEAIVPSFRRGEFSELMVERIE